MENYDAYLPELKNMPLFQDLEDDALLALLQALGPKIIRKKAGEPPEPPVFGKFKILLKSGSPRAQEPRRFKWAMPAFGEPGFLMGEIPSLSRFFAADPKPMRHKGLFKKKHPIPPTDVEMLEVSGEMLTRYYNAEVAPAQGVMLRNLLGMLAQKVIDTRRELFLLRDGVDLFQAEADAAAPGTGA
jgi:hypothetical protein